MLRNIFLKSIRDSRYTFLYVFLTYLFVCSLIMYVVSELPLNEKGRRLRGRDRKAAHAQRALRYMAGWA